MNQISAVFIQKMTSQGAYRCIFEVKITTILLKMKTVIALILFLSLTTVSFAQTTAVSAQETQISNVIKENTTVVKKATATSKMQRRVKKLNHKKSNQIISIKAYRKSLNVKVKTVKLC